MVRIFPVSECASPSSISSISESSRSERELRTYSVERVSHVVCCSRRVRASRIHPRAAFAMISSASVSACIHSLLVTNSRHFIISFSVNFLKSNSSDLDRIVSGTFSISVVARMNFTCAGGSSRVFRSALNAPVESIWTSSMI